MLSRPVIGGHRRGRPGRPPRGPAGGGVPVGKHGGRVALSGGIPVIGLSGGIPVIGFGGGILVGELGTRLVVRAGFDGGKRDRGIALIVLAGLIAVMRLVVLGRRLIAVVPLVVLGRLIAVVRLVVRGRLIAVVRLVVLGRLIAVVRLVVLGRLVVVGHGLPLGVIGGREPLGRAVGQSRQLPGQLPGVADDPVAFGPDPVGVSVQVLDALLGIGGYLRSLLTRLLQPILGLGPRLGGDLLGR